MAKLTERAHQVRAVGLSFVASIPAYNQFAVPVLGHVAQCYNPPCTIIKVERECLQLLPRAPRHAFPPCAMLNLKSIGFEVEPRPVSLTCQSALIRASIRSELLQDMVEWIRNASQSVEAALYALSRPFRPDSV
eukprot:1310870-Pyramimonas_sp.AAC.1